MTDHKIADLVPWAEKNVILEDGKPIKFEAHQKRILNRAFKVGKDGRVPYSTVVYSCPKKSGKTTIGAIVSLWFAYELEPGTEVILAANDLEQSTGRVFKMCREIIERSPVLKSRVKSITAREIILTDGTTIRAIPTDAAGEAGANQSLAVFDELWGYTSERSRRLYEELTPVPTRRNSVRLVCSYAGFEAESELLEEIYRRGKAGRKIWALLPCYVVGSMFCYWDCKARMPWQTPEYYKAQRQELRPLAFARLHRNEWVSSESALIDMDVWGSCIDPNHHVPREGLDLFIGVDASTKKDRAAVCSVYWGEGDKLYLGPKRSWQPSKNQPLDIESTMEAFLKDLDDRHYIENVFFDPFQFHRSAMTLEKEGLRMTEFPQTQDRLIKMTSDFLDMLTHRNLVLYRDKELGKAAKQAVGKESARGVRITKEKRSHKIDEIIALAMAVAAAIEEAPDDDFPARVLTIFGHLATGPTEDKKGFWLPLKIW